MTIVDDNQWEPDEEFFLKLALVPKVSYHHSIWYYILSYHISQQVISCLIRCITSYNIYLIIFNVRSCDIMSFHINTLVIPTPQSQEPDPARPRLQPLSPLSPQIPLSPPHPTITRTRPYTTRTASTGEPSSWEGQASWKSRSSTMTVCTQLYK